MAQRTFVFCDVCNPQGFRIPEQRRAPQRGDRRGRRQSDGRAWFEGSIATALEAGWRETDIGSHVCPQCVAMAGLDEDSIDTAQTDRQFIFCDCCNTQGIRFIEQRRHPGRAVEFGRRVSDSRAWVEGDEQTAFAQGWFITETGKHYCQRCTQRHPELLRSDVA